MNNNTTHYLRCIYCGHPGQHSKKVSKSVGKFRIKELYNNVLLLECQKCGRVSRIKKVGPTLEWSNMTKEEKKIFQRKAWVSYSNLNKTEDKNENR